MALKITISSTQDAIDFLNIIMAGHNKMTDQLDLLSKRQNQLIHEELERREYRVNREESIKAKEKKLNIGEQ